MTSRLRSSVAAAARLAALAATALVLVATSRPLPRPPGDCRGGGEAVAVHVSGDCGPEGDALLLAKPGTCRFDAESSPSEVFPVSGHYRGHLAALSLGPEIVWRRTGDGDAPPGGCDYSRREGSGVPILECRFWEWEGGKSREVGRCRARIARRAGAPATGGSR